MQSEIKQMIRDLNSVERGGIAPLIDWLSNVAMLNKKDAMKVAIQLARRSHWLRRIEFVRDTKMHEKTGMHPSSVWRGLRQLNNADLISLENKGHGELPRVTIHLPIYTEEALNV